MPWERLQTIPRMHHSPVSLPPQSRALKAIQALGAICALVAVDAVLAILACLWSAIGCGAFAITGLVVLSLKGQTICVLTVHTIDTVATADAVDAVDIPVAV